jgi:hypothetical protein
MILPDLLGVLGLVLIVIAVLIGFKVIAGGLLFALIVGVLGLLCLSGFGPRYRGRTRA